MKLAQTRGSTASALSVAPPARLLQRKCACGRGGGFAEQCEECSHKQLGLDQRGQNSAPGHDFGEIQIYAAQESRSDQSQKSVAGEEAGGEEDPSIELDEPLIPQEAAPQPPSTGLEETPPPEAMETKKKAPALKITSETVATTPADRARTKIGIGEEIVCSTDPSTNVNWSVTGGGAIAPASGTSTTFTASKSPSKPTVKATSGATPATIAFDVVPPDGMTVKASSNPGNGTPGPPNNRIGFKTIFDCLVKPDDVSFYRVEFQENIPKDTWKWPDGTDDSNGPKQVPWSVRQDNKTTDNVTSALRPIRRINDGSKDVDFGYTIRVPEDYKNEAGTWVTWLANEEHYKEFAGATQKGRGTLKATNNDSGTWQGPWL
jgi:hypothetical protein